jgi:hypothetical protein
MTFSLRRVAVGAALATVGGLFAATLVAAPASAATLSVTNNNSSGAGSLAQAIIDANLTPVEDEITFTMGPGNVTTPLTLTEPLDSITQPLIITGPGRTALTIVTDNGTDGIRVAGDDTNAVEITGLTFDTEDAANTTDGLVSDDANITLTDVSISNYPGIGVVVHDGDLDADNSYFNQNLGGIFWDGNDDADTDGIRLTNVRVVNNTNDGIHAVSAVATGFLDFTDVLADNNGGSGLDVQGPAVQLLRVGGGEYRNNGVAGVHLDLTSASTVTLENVYSHHNDQRGFQLALVGGDVLATGVIAEANGTVDPQPGGGASVALDGAVFQTFNSSYIDNRADFAGGGIDFPFLVGDSSVLLDNVTVAGNTVNPGNVSNGGGIAVGQVNGSGGPQLGINISNSDINDNTASGNGGGIYVDHFGSGVNFDGGFYIQNTTIDDNHALAGDGGGIYFAEFSGQTVPSQSGFIGVFTSTISNNEALNGAGGAFSLGKGGHSGAQPAAIQFENVTISDNKSESSGAGIVRNESGTIHEVDVRMTFVTIAGNSSGLVIDDPAFGFALLNSIIGNNGAQDLAGAPGLNGVYTAQYSLVQAPDAGALAYLQAGAGNVTGVDPKLGALANNGGPTLTRLPLATSPVFDAADPAFTAANFPKYDQRELPRILGGRADMGAVESPTPPRLAATGSELNVMLPLGALLLLLAGAALLATRRLARRLP